MNGTLGNYELVRELGAGAWGRVYLARQTTLGGRLVAVKTLLPHLAADARARQRFLDEAHDMARLSHPNIVQVLEVGEQDGTYYFAMMYVEGETLADFLTRERRIPYGQAAGIVAQIAEALGHAHSRNVVHRDIKPGNILMDRQGRPLITDFGIAKVGEGSGLTMTGGTIGTPEFMSPEQAQGNPVDGRSDLYSLGIVLYYLTTGFVPFGGGTPVAVGMKHVHEPPPDPSAFVPGYPPWLSQILVQALAKQPCDRFATGEQMAAALRTGAAGAAAQGPVAAPMPPAPLPTAPVPPAGRAPGPAPAATPGAPAAHAGRRSRTALVSALLAAIFFVGSLLGTSAWLRLRPAAPSAAPSGIADVLPPSLGGSSGSPAASMPPPEVVATVARLHEAISRHQPAAAVACFVPGGDGQAPYHLDEAGSYQGIESSVARDFGNYRRVGDAVTLTCTVDVQRAQDVVTTPFAYRLRRGVTGWLIDAISKTGDSQIRSGRADRSNP